MLGAAYNLLSLMIVTSGQGTSPATALCMPQGLQTGNPETQENKDIPSLAKTRIRQKTHFAQSGCQPQHTELEKRLRAYQDQARSQEWFQQPPQGPWLSVPHPYFYNQPDPSFWLNNQQNSLSRQQRSFQTVSHQQELPQYSYLFPQERMKQELEELRLKPHRMESESQTLEDANKNFQNGQETLSLNATCAPAPNQSWEGGQSEPGCTEESSATCRQSSAVGRPSFARPWDHPGYKQEE